MATCRTLGLAEVTFIAIGMTIGGGIFVFTGIVLKVAGPAMPVAYALAWIPVLISMLPLAMLGAAIPTTGGNYKYPSRLVSPALAFTSIWVYALATFFGQIPLYALTAARYLQAVFPSVPLLTCAAVIVTGFCLINVLGVAFAAQLQGAMVVVLAAAILLYGVQGPLAFDAQRFAGLTHTAPRAMLLGTALLTFTYLGANGVIELGSDIKDPGVTIPRALFITFPVVATLYLLVAFTTVNAAPWHSLLTVDEPVIMTARASLSHAAFVFFMLGGAVLALTTTLNALFIFGTKSLLVIVEDGLLPASLGTINAPFGTAHWLFAIIWVVSMLGLFSGLSLETFASYSALGGIGIFVPVLLAGSALPTRFPEAYRTSAFALSRGWLRVCTVVGIGVSGFFAVVILADLHSVAKVLFFLGFALSGWLCYAWRVRVLRARGVEFEATIAAAGWSAS